MANAKRLDVLSPRPKKDGSTYWHRVGTAWEGEKGISVVFDSLPLPDKEGRVSVSLFEPRESGGKTPEQNSRAHPQQHTAGGGVADDGDSIPF